MAGSNSLSFLFGPFVAFLVVVLLAFLLRWAFSSGGSLVERTPRRGHTDEYGLLVPVATPPTAADAELLRATLEENGIRATVTATDEGPRLMVFRTDEATARRLIAG